MQCVGARWGAGKLSGMVDEGYVPHTVLCIQWGLLYYIVLYYTVVYCGVLYCTVYSLWHVALLHRDVWRGVVSRCRAFSSGFCPSFLCLLLWAQRLGFEFFHVVVGWRL